MKKEVEKNILLVSMVSILLVVIIAFASYSSWTGMAIFEEDLPLDYVAYWDFEGTLEDVANNQDGSCREDIYEQLCPQVTSGAVGDAYRFDGVKEYIEIESSDFLDINGPLTISVWTRTTNIGNNKKIVDKMKFTGSTFKAGYRLQIGSDNQVEFLIANNELEFLKDPEIITDGAWYHLVGIYNGSQLFLYRDGVLVNSKTTSLTSIKSNNHVLKIGVAADSLNNYFKGDIDEVIIFNRALSQREVLNIYEIQKNGERLVEEIIEDDSSQNVAPEVNEQSPDSSGVIEPDAGEKIKDIGKNPLTMWMVIGLLLILAIVILLKKWPFEKTGKKKGKRKHI